MLSFQGIDAAVNKELGDKLKNPPPRRQGEDYAQSMGEGVRSKAPDIGRAIDEGNRGGIKTAAKGAAESFGRGVLDGIEQGLRDAGGKTPLARWRRLGKRPAETVMMLCCSRDIRLIKWPPRWQLSGGTS